MKTIKNKRLLKGVILKLIKNNGIILSEVDITQKIPFIETKDMLSKLVLENKINKKIIAGINFYWAVSNYCHFCGTKLVSDKLSKKYGDYCPNELCGQIK